MVAFFNRGIQSLLFEKRYLSLPQKIYQTLEMSKSCKKNLVCACHAITRSIRGGHTCFKQHFHS